LKAEGEIWLGEKKMQSEHEDLFTYSLKFVSSQKKLKLLTNELISYGYV
jgi:hypothetical protein